MTKLLLAIFLIMFGYKTVAGNTIASNSVVAELFPLSEEAQIEPDEKQENKQDGKQDDLFYLPIPSIPTFTISVLQLSPVKYCKPFSGFTTRLFSPPDFI